MERPDHPTSEGGPGDADFPAHVGRHQQRCSPSPLRDDISGHQAHPQVATSGCELFRGLTPFPQHRRLEGRNPHRQKREHEAETQLGDPTDTLIERRGKRSESHERNGAST